MPRVRRRLYSVAAVFSVVLLASGLVLILAPALRVNRAPGIAALLPARDALTVGIAGLAGIAVTFSFWRAVRPILTPIAAVLLVMLVIAAPTMLARGLRILSPAAAASGQLRILEWNTNGDLVRPAVIASLAAREKANVIVLPDAQIGVTAQQYRHAFTAIGIPVIVFAAPDAASQTAVLMTAPLAIKYRFAGTGPDAYKSLVLTPKTSRLPRIIALHAPQPTPHNMAAWRTDLQWVSHECSHGAVLAVGDFNASIDNFGSDRLGACQDVATTERSGSIGTWPTRLPGILAMPIDHALISRSAGNTKSFTVLNNEDRSGARHRPTLTVIRSN